ncbi:Lrp/AsnC family transcriptional regulator [Candidatus Woesearchaeota archaeon]|nr:Lrp/AsnC family transcriptional regulator [Candidatus Woesearchaeota archaeon]
MKLDKQDLGILELLKQDGNLTTSRIGKKLGLPITTVHNRIKKLRKEGIIKRYTIETDDAKLGYILKAFILVTADYGRDKQISQEGIVKKLLKLEEVEEAKIVTGTIDIIIRIRTKGIEDLNNFLLKKLRNIEGIDKTQTMVILG